MASNPTTPHDSIAELGFFAREDFDIGQSVDAHYAKHGYYFKNKPGLELAKRYTFDNEQTRSILNSFFLHCSLGLIKSYGPSSRDYCILNRISPNPEPQALMVLLWPSGSSMIFRSGSHKHLLEAGGSGIGLLQVPPENLDKPDIRTKKVEMEMGGLSISDARISFRVLKGPIVFLGFVEPEELKYWAKMELPRLPELMKLVEEMQTEEIGANFEFKAPSEASSTSPSV